MVRQPLRSSLSATVIIRLFPHLCCSISLLITTESVLMGLESFTLLYPTLVNKGVVLPMSSYRSCCGDAHKVDNGPLHGIGEVWQITMKKKTTTKKKS
ncbi:hypothetical protein F5878DRAFT_399325 [Lentinula raphanica]|uniref:Secreted protein n=1 Tax=Lentinula raphanica TaxID=153919 RepID=A0AA38NZQ7_9AGAR|nr:hypothetical protein F5878DRAFT_399325 [Lentinula raphanica]